MGLLMSRLVACLQTAASGSGTRGVLGVRSQGGQVLPGAPLAS